MRNGSSPRAGTEAEMSVENLHELEVMAAKLLATARKLPPGLERTSIFKEIGQFRSQIIVLQGAGLRPASREPRMKAK